MVVLFDHHPAVAGGQVVLRELSSVLADVAPVVAAVPAALHKSLWDIPGPDTPGLLALSGPRQSVAGELLSRSAHTGVQRWLLLANTYPVLVGVLRTAHALRRAGAAVTTAAVLHSYPGSSRRRVVVRGLLERCDIRLPVEPNLSRVVANVESMSVLVTNAAPIAAVSERLHRTDMIKTYARLDPSKGLHLLPAVFESCEHNYGLTCRVAVTEGLEGRRGYERKTIESLRPWLEPKSRDSRWMDAGDIFLASSIYGEAVSLTIQEAMHRGCFVIAPRLGALPFLSVGGGGVIVYEPGNQTDMMQALARAARLNEREFSNACRRNQKDIVRRQGYWYREAAAILQSALWTTP